MTKNQFTSIVPWHVRTSWGMTEIKEGNGEITFGVNGKKFTGQVTVQSRDGYCNVSMKKDGAVVSLASEIKEKDLCSVLDTMIETN